MGKFSRTEVENTFRDFRAALGRAMQTRNWVEWSQFFTEDALYVEHAMGTFRGRGEIYDWIVRTMSSPLLDEIESFPVGWHVIDEEKGWVIAEFRTVMRDPGDGRSHETYCFTLLKYAGNGQWNYEEDIYNPASMESMLKAWSAAKAAAA